MADPVDLGSDDYQPPRDDWNNRKGPIFWPQNPRFPGWQKNTSWDWAHRKLTAEETKIVWVGPNLKWWDLAGNLAGRQGIIATNVLSGVGMIPFEHKYSEGPYVEGATLERTDIKKRIIKFGVRLQPNANARADAKFTSSFKYRYLENLWWSSWSKDRFGYLGFFTRATGWRWIKCVLESDTNGDFDLDPVAFRNNSAIYDMSVVAVDPYFYKMPYVRTWKNDPVKVEVDGTGFGSGFISLANRGTVISHPKFIVTCPGHARVADGPDRLIDLPDTTVADKFYMVDTAPNELAIQGSVDPVDNPWYRFIRQAGLLDYFLHDIAIQGLPLWQRWENPVIFDYAVGPFSSVTAKVQHNYPNAEITMIMPQRYEAAWG
jgi:hypothetical protein